MKILFLTQYFPPETGAPQNRLFELALKLREFGAEVEVITAFPNYPTYRVSAEYRGKWYQKETMEGMALHRCFIFARPGKGLLFRLLNYFSFTFSALWTGIFKASRPDLLLCESPPLFLGWTAVWLKRYFRCRLLFNVSDLWPESAVKLGLVKNKALLAMSVRLEEWIYRNADLISGQTQGIVADIRRRFPQKPYFWLKNGVDGTTFVGRLSGRNWRRENGFEPKDLLFYFGGLLGYAQGLDCLLLAAEQLHDLPQVHVILVGEGPEKDRLIRQKEELGLEIVHFFPGVSKNEIADVIQAMDVGLIPLKKIDLFMGAIPSKIFEILCLKKPVLLGIEGEARELFIDAAQAGWAFEPENHRELAALMRQIAAAPGLLAEKGGNGFEYVCRNFDRSTIAKEFWTFIQAP